MACPNPQQLEALLQARVTDQEEAEWAAHLNHCLECRHRLEALAGGADLVPRRVTCTPLPPSEPAPALDRIMGQLRGSLPRRAKFRSPAAAVPADGAATPDLMNRGQGHRQRVAPTRLAFPWTRRRPSPSRPMPEAGRWRGHVTGAGLCVLLGWLFLEVEPLGLRLRFLSYDLPLALRGPLQPPEVLVVSMDTNLQRRLNPDRPEQWSRSVHAAMLHRARALGAEAVVFDILFPPRDDPPADQEDHEFVAAMRAMPGKVVLGAKLVERLDGNLFQSVLEKPIPAFEAAARWGLVNFTPEPDGAIRRHYVNSEVAHASLAWRTAEVLGRAPRDPARSRWMNYYGPRKILPAMPYDLFLDQPLGETNLFAGKTLFVGWSPAQPDDEDEYKTPYTRWGYESLTGVQLHATAFLNLIRNEWLEELPRAWEYGLLLVCGVGLAMGLGRWRPGWALAGAVAGFLLLLVGACLLVWIGHWWFPWLIIGGVQIPCALLWSVMANLQRLAQGQAAMQKTLERVREPPSQATIRTSPPAPAAGDPRRLPEIPDHVPLRCVGRGAYGEVWLARDVIGGFRAVKVVYRNTFAQDEPFEREFRGIKKFTPISRLHPGWVDILHVGRNDAHGYFYYIMELGDDETAGPQIDPDRYVPKTLAGELRKRGHLPLTECLALGLALADALEHLHRHALIHRDIKPSNVIFVRGAPKFTDIGLVTEVSSRREVSWLGTEGYMAPEGPGTPAADVFGLGKLIYEMATGRDRQAFPELPTSVREPASPAEWPQLQRILLKACEEDAAKRYARAADLSRDLLQLRHIIHDRASGP